MADGASPWPKWSLEKEVQAPLFFRPAGASLLVPWPCHPPQPHRERVVPFLCRHNDPETQQTQVQANNHFLDQLAIPLPENAALGHCPCSFCSCSPYPVSPSLCLRLAWRPRVGATLKLRVGRHEDQEGLDSNPPSPTL